MCTQVMGLLKEGVFPTGGGDHFPLDKCACTPAAARPDGNTSAACRGGGCRWRSRCALVASVRTPPPSTHNHNHLPTPPTPRSRVADAIRASQESGRATKVFLEG